MGYEHDPVRHRLPGQEQPIAEELILKPVERDGVHELRVDDRCGQRWRGNAVPKKVFRAIPAQELILSVAIRPDSDINNVVFHGIYCRLAAHTDILPLCHAPPATLTKIFVKLLVREKVGVLLMREVFDIFLALALLFLPADSLYDDFLLARLLTCVLRVAFGLVEEGQLSRDLVKLLRPAAEPRLARDAEHLRQLLAAGAQFLVLFLYGEHEGDQLLLAKCCQFFPSAFVVFHGASPASFPSYYYTRKGWIWPIAPREAFVIFFWLETGGLAHGQGRF